MWTLSPQPQINEQATFSEVARLGIFAARYQIFALSNQVTDMIRSNLANDHWQLEASMVDEIYEAVPTESPLRKVVRAALGTLPRPSVESEGRAREEWRATFLKHAELGLDYYEVGGSGWTPLDYLSGACRFHEHQGVSHQEELSVFENQCMYAREECFPSWEEENVKGREDEVDGKEWRAVVQERDGEQERCEADEEREEGELSIEGVVDEAKEPLATEAVVNGVVTEAGVDGVATEAEVNGVAAEAEVDGVATEAEVNSEAAEAGVDGMTTGAEVNGEATEAGVAGVTTEAVVNGEAKGGGVDGVTTEAVINGEATEAGVASVTTEAVEAEADVMATESVSAEGDVVATDTVVDGVEGSVAVGALAVGPGGCVGGTVVGGPPESKKKSKTKKKKAKQIGQS